MPFMPQVAHALARLRARERFTADDGLVFVNGLGEWIDRSALYRRYKKAQEAAGLRPLKLHDLRHTFGHDGNQRRDDRGCPDVDGSRGHHHRLASTCTMPRSQMLRLVSGPWWRL